MPTCRFCNTELTNIFCDLGSQPPSNSFLTKEQLDEPEILYPLKVYVCDKCWLVQLPENKKATEIFKDDYPYYSSQSPSNVSHAKEYVDMMIERFGFGKDSCILEIGSNDGYLLQWFKAMGCDVLGVEPSVGPANMAENKGINTVYKFFPPKDVIFKEAADLICGINVLAHQPDINDFVEGLRIALKPDGIVTMEFPHLMKLVEGLQFDTIYHEHYSYFSFITICEIFRKHELEVFDVDELPTHGGSLRIYARHYCDKYVSGNIKRLYDGELFRNMGGLSYYLGFQDKINKIKSDFVEFMYDRLAFGLTVVAHGGAAKANTFLNFCGIKSDLIPFIVDRSPYKQGKYLPGSHIPVVDEVELKKVKPSYVLITAWNLTKEIEKQLEYTRDWGCKFVTAIPELTIW